jgi:hypothetical protein
MDPAIKENKVTPIIIMKIESNLSPEFYGDISPYPTVLIVKTVK